MNNYKINKNKSSLSTEQVLKHKDFNKLLHEYKGVYNYKTATKPFYKNIKFLGIIVLVCTVALVVMVVDKEEDEQPKEVKKKEEVIKQVPLPITPASDTVTQITTETATISKKKEQPKKSVVKKDNIIVEDPSGIVVPDEPKNTMPVQETKEKPKREVEIKNNDKPFYKKSLDLE